MLFKSNKCIVCIIAIVVAIVLIWNVFSWGLHYFTVPVGYHGPPHPRGDLPPFPGSTPDNLWWFVQMTDTHIRCVDDPILTASIRDFRQFCTEHLKIIQPTMVMLTGDITDGYPSSSDNVEDWITYQNILAEAALPHSLMWLDVRGNHDNYNVPAKRHPNNLFRNYSVLRDIGDSSFLFKLSLPSGTYSFIHIDALLKIGLGRPWNFFGIMDEMDVYQLRRLTETANQLTSNHTLFFGHYPTSTILAPAGLYDVLRSGTAFLCGHLHHLGLNPGMQKMYTLQRYGSLELELDDWMENRKYRIMAFDHDLLSFVDVTFGNWPVVLITNPKSAEFLVPGHEPVNRMLHSSHIRMLVFSPDSIEYAKVEIDDIFLGVAKAVDGGPLFVMQWIPTDYLTGLHVISVKVRDSAGRVTTISHQFSLDESRPDQPFGSAFILMMARVYWSEFCIVGLQCLCILPLMFFRRYAEKPYPGITNVPLLYGLLIAAHTDDIYFSLLVMVLYPIIGPWFVGTVLKNTYGVVTMYGVYVNDTFIEEKWQMGYFLKDLILFHIPLTLLCILHLSRAHSLHTKPIKSNEVAHTTSSSSRRIGDVIRVIISLFLLKPISTRLRKRMSLMHAHGTMGILVSPKYTWTFVVGFYLLCRCVYLGFKRTRQEKPSLTVNGEATHHEIMMPPAIILMETKPAK